MRFLTLRPVSLDCIMSSLLALLAERFEVLTVELEGGVQQTGVGVHRLAEHRLERLHLSLRALHQAAGHLLAALHPLPELRGHIPEEALDEVRALLLERRVALDDLPVGFEALGEGAAGTLLALDRLLDGIRVALHGPGQRPVGLSLALEHAGHALDPTLGELDVPLLRVHGVANHLPVGLTERLCQPPRRLVTCLRHSFLLRPLSTPPAVDSNTTLSRLPVPAVLRDALPGQRCSGRLPFPAEAVLGLHPLARFGV